MTQVVRTVAGAAAATTITAPMTAGSPASGGGTFSVANGSGYPTANFVVVVDRGLSTEEKILISSRSANVLTVGTSGRGFDGTAAAAHSNGATLEHELDAAVITALLEHVNTNAGDDHASTYLNLARHDVTARHTFGAALGTPAAGADVATVAAAGTGTSPARSDHVHKIGAGAINSAGMFAAGVVDAAAIATDAVGSAEIAADAVGSSEIAANAVGSSELADNAVDTAAIADAAVTVAKIAAEAWTAYTPTLTQSGAVTKTVNSARYQQTGKTVRAQILLSVTGSGTANNPIIVGLPVNAASTAAMGVGEVYDASANVLYDGVAVGSGVTGVLLRLNGTTGAVAVGQTGSLMSAALANGDTVSFNIVYEAA